MTGKVLGYIALFLCVGTGIFAINSPEIRCVMVVPNGNVVLSWAIPADPNNEFQSYEVYSATALGGPYSNIASIPTYTTGSYSAVGVNANTQPYFFYVQVKNTSGIASAAVDTVKTIFLIMNSPANSNIASFQWNDFHIPLPPGESGSYKIFREYPLNNWTQIASMPVHNSTGPYYFNDTISVCYDSINYRVELFDPQLSCTSISNIRGNWFMDKNRPQPPVLDSVSVDLAGNVVMGIHPSPSPDTRCYIVYKWVSGTYVGIDTLCTNNIPTIFTYTNSNAGNSSEEFSVAALDSCGNISVIATNNQATIYLSVVYSVCGRSNTLTWNKYKNMAGGIDHYEILYSLNSGPYVHIADTTAAAASYVHQNLMPGAKYCYRVRAHSKLKNLAQRDSITSTSEFYCITTVAGSFPSYVYLSDVTVNNPPEDITIKWYVDKTVKVGGFEIYRADSYTGPYSKLGFAGYTAQSGYAYSDNSARANAQKYYYYLTVLDTCMTPQKNTDTSFSIFLTAAATGNFQATVNWSDYGKWPGGVSGYNIYRSLDGAFGSPVATVPYGTNTYVDDLSNYTTYSGKFTYYVEAIEAGGNPYGLSERSESNQADIYLEAKMFVPNAFVPKGHNKIFLPIGDYIEKSEYKLSIFDRWGTKIYETTDENQGWDGGHYVEGLYGYQIEYKNAMGEYRSQTGTVTLVR